MITKYRNRAFIQMGIALVLSISLGILTLFLYDKRNRHETDSENWVILFIVLYHANYIMWIAASLSLALAKGYPRDFGGAVFMTLMVFGICIPCVSHLFPVFVIFGFEDRAKKRSRSH